MKKFVIKILSFVLSVAIVSLAINYIYLKKCDLGNSKFLYVPDEIKVCNLGSSHGKCGFNYEDYAKDITCFNFALDSQSLSYDYRILENYKSKLSKGSIVLITISFFSPYGTMPESETEDFEARNQRYYRFLPPYRIKKYDISTDMLLGHLRSMNGRPTYVINTLFSDGNNNIPINLEKDYWLNSDDIKDTDWLNEADELNISEDAKAAYIRHLVKNKRDEKQKLVYNKEEVDALQNIVDLCNNIGATPVLVTTPYLKDYLNCIEEDNPLFYENFYTWIMDFATENHVSYFDYSHDERFIDRYELFMNVDHLNKEGARLFTSYIWKEVIPEVSSGVNR